MFERAAVILARSHIAADDFDAAVRRIVDPLPLFAVIVTDGVGVLLFKLVKLIQLSMMNDLMALDLMAATYFINVQVFAKLVPPEL